jgi:hypothetical protein
MEWAVKELGLSKHEDYYALTCKDLRSLGGMLSSGIDAWVFS